MRRKRNSGEEIVNKLREAKWEVTPFLGRDEL